MFAHLMKSLWRRKAKNLLISFEIFLIFLVIFAVVSGVVYNTQLYNTPLGFQSENVWTISVRGQDRSNTKTDTVFYGNLKRDLLAMPEIESLSFVEFSPYSRSAMQSRIRLPESDLALRSYFLRMDDDALKTLGLSVAEGRWFSAEDEGAGLNSAIINRELANRLFPGQNAIGKVMSNSEKLFPGQNAADKIMSNSETMDKENKLLRVVGVVEEYRYWGEFMPQENLVLTRFSPIAVQERVENIVIKLKPGTPRVFEAKLYQQLKLTRNDLEYVIADLRDERKNEMRGKSIFFVPPVLIAIFLLIMVAFGLFGVLWQNTTKRIPEIGLRRAIGASSANIYSQIIVEQCLLSSLAMAVGLLIVIQLPITGAMGKFVEWQGFLISAGCTMALIYAMSILCSLYPAWLASRLSPTEALHYE